MKIKNLVIENQFQNESNINSSDLLRSSFVLMSLLLLRYFTLRNSNRIVVGLSSCIIISDNWLTHREFDLRSSIGGAAFLRLRLLWNHLISQSRRRLLHSWSLSQRDLEFVGQRNVFRQLVPEVLELISLLKCH